MKNITLKNKKGFSLIEVIIACTIITVSVLAVMSVASKGIELSNRSLSQAQANTLLEEGAEVVKSIRDAGWSNISSLSLDTEYYLFFDTTTNTWSFNLQDETPLGSIPNYPIDSTFNRTVVFSSVLRDGEDNIVSSLGDIDDGTKRVTINVSWVFGGEIISRELSFYLMDIFS
ncbi:MAG: prepilin-type N-terminal cleavage/methylation domain-containing protein [Candidatus Pacebacteria bacterium]|nr:prepilin-type N-terminal cleavage/methylation domain-containing protein [Candidatus Paceibacterota bacterium]